MVRVQLLALIMAKKKKDNREEKVSRPITIAFTETTLKKVMLDLRASKMCYDDSILSDTRAMDIILKALMSGEYLVVVDFDN